MPQLVRSSHKLRFTAPEWNLTGKLQLQHVELLDVLSLDWVSVSLKHVGARRRGAAVFPPPGRARV